MRCYNLANNEVDCTMFFQTCPYNTDWQEAKLCCRCYEEADDDN